MWDKLKNAANNMVMDASKYIYTPPEQDQFTVNGQLSPEEFKKAGDHLVSVIICQSWSWKPSSNPNFKSKYLDEQKQYLVHEKALCKRRIGNAITGEQETIQTSDGDEVVVLHGQKEEEEKEEDIRFYIMYIIYDEYYYTPRMFFSATDIEGKPIDNERIKEDIQKEYLDKTLTIEPFPFFENVSMATVHPCKHANVLKSMSDSMRESGQKIESHFALLIFLKFISSVIPTVEFDMTGDLHFQ